MALVGTVGTLILGGFEFSFLHTLSISIIIYSPNVQTKTKPEKVVDKIASLTQASTALSTSFKPTFLSAD
ncbi:hypothetical protein ACE6H2_015072 [Prunus campanulata]